jgi:hypothetical protein
MLPFKHSFNPTTSTEGDPVHEYQDIQVFNNSTGSNRPIPCIFNQTKLTNVVDKSNDYYISVVRWSADSILPQIIPEMVLGLPNTAPPLQNYIGLTNYSVGIVENYFTTGPQTSVAMSSVIYKPSTNIISSTYEQPILNPSNQNEVYNDPYFWISNINEFLSYLNASLFQAATLVSALDETGNPLPGLHDVFTDKTKIPTFSYNSATGKIELLCPTVEFTPFTLAKKGDKYYTVAVNEPLFNLLNTFYMVESPGTYYTLFTTFPTKVISFNIQDPNINLFLIQVPVDFGRSAFASSAGVGTTSFEVSVCTQTNSSITSMSPVNSIVFQTTSIPVNNTLTGAPAFLGQNLQGNNALQNNAGVLTDFQVPLVSGTEYSGSMLYYVPSSEYRLLDLTANTPVQTLNIAVYWLDKIGNYHPFLIKNQGGASLKLMFRKKTYNGTF